MKTPAKVDWREMRANREVAAERVKALAAEGATIKAELEPLATQVIAAQTERLNLHSQLANVRAQVRALEAPLDPQQFPSATDEHNRVEQLALWRTKQQELLELHHDALSRETAARPRAVELQRRLLDLQCGIGNQQALAEGRRPGTIDGGLAVGSEEMFGYGPTVRR
jgi:chromosome segregation ATPase